MPDQSDPMDQQMVSVSQGTKAYIRQHPWGIVASVVVAFVLGVILIRMIILHPDNIDAMALLIFPLGMPLVVVAYIARRIQAEFMQQFAEANGYTFSPHGDIETLSDGSLFRIGAGSREMKNVVSGQYLGCPILLFDYKFDTGSGKSRITHDYTIFQLQFDTMMPDLLLEKKDLSEDMLLGQLPEHITLEGDFSKYFSLSIKKGYEVEALEVFTPDVMTELEEKCTTISLEIVNNHLFMYKDNTVTTKTDLYAFYSIAQYFIQKLGPVLVRMKPTLEATVG